MATSKSIFLPSETRGDNIYDSISDTALRFLASTFILTTSFRSTKHTGNLFLWNNLPLSLHHLKSVYIIWPTQICTWLSRCPWNLSKLLSRSNQTRAPSNYVLSLTIHFFIRPISLVILYMGGCLCVFVFYIYSYNGRILQ